MLGMLNCIAPIVIIGGVMYLMIWIFNKDKKRELNPSDDFKKENLLYRYGYEINHTTLSIPVRTDWTEQQIDKFISVMRQRIAQQITSRFSAIGVQVTNPVNIKDRDKPSDSRSFLKIVFRSARGSQVSHFIYYAPMGKYVVIHYIALVRGKYRWHDVADFAISGPVSIWLWLLDWIQNQYSIIASISKFIGNSYDLLDLKSYFESSYLVLMDETRTFLKEVGLLTEEINSVIIQNINNSQNINVTNSKNTNLSGLVNTVQDVVQNIIPLKR
jgi:hypothetical protein